MNERIIDYIGEENFRKIANAKVLLIGLGGVGGYTFEALVRSGIKFITVIDFDTFENSNFNRQIYATIDSLNKNKAQIAALRASKINPEAKITCLEKKLSQDDITKEFVTEYDYILDACDDTLVKVELMKVCALYHVKLISCMGTGNKLDPTQFKITDIYKTKNCPLCKVMRYELRKRGVKKLKVVFSEEMPKKPKLDEVVSCINGCVCNFDNGRSCTNRRQIPGSISFVPPVAGFILAGEVINTFLDKKYD